MRPAPRARAATPAATLAGFSFVYDVTLVLEPLRYSRAVLRYSSMSTFWNCPLRLLNMSPLMPRRPRNCSRPLLSVSAWPQCVQYCSSEPVAPCVPVSEALLVKPPRSCPDENVSESLPLTTPIGAPPPPLPVLMPPPELMPVPVPPEA